MKKHADNIINITENIQLNNFFSNNAVISFYFGIIILFFMKFLGLKFEDNLYKIGTGISILFLSYKIINTRYSFNEIRRIFLLFLVACIAFIISKRPALSITILIIIASKSINKQLLIRAIFYTCSLAYLSVLLGCWLGFIENIQITIDRFNGSEYFAVARNSLGYYHPNVTFMYFFVIVCMYLIYKKNKLQTYTYFLIGITGVILYKLTYSRTGFICLFLVVLMSIIIRYSPKFMAPFKNIINLSPILIGYGILVISYLYNANYNFFKFLDSLLTGRLYYSNLFLKSNPISLIGQSMSVLENAEVFLDSGYVLLYVTHGIIIFSLVLIGYGFIMRKIPHNNILLYVCLVLNIYFLSEYFISNILINFTLIYFNVYLFEGEVLLDD